MKKPLFAYAKDMELIVHKTNGRHSTLIVTPEDMGSKGFILGTHTMDPGGGAPEHRERQPDCHRSCDSHRLVPSRRPAPRRLAGEPQAVRASGAECYRIACSPLPVASARGLDRVRRGHDPVGGPRPPWAAKVGRCPCRRAGTADRDGARGRAPRPAPS